MVVKIVVAAVIGAFFGAFAWEHVRRSFISERIPRTIPPQAPMDKTKRSSQSKDWRDVN